MSQICAHISSLDTRSRQKFLLRTVTPSPTDSHGNLRRLSSLSLVYCPCLAPQSRNFVYRTRWGFQRSRRFEFQRKVVRGTIDSSFVLSLEGDLLDLAPWVCKARRPADCDDLPNPFQEAVESSHRRRQYFKRQRHMRSTSHPRRQGFKHHRQPWSASHPHRLCFKHQRQLRSTSHPRRQCFKRQRQLWSGVHLSRAANDSCASASCEVHLTHTGSVLSCLIVGQRSPWHAVPWGCLIVGHYILWQSGRSLLHRGQCTPGSGRPHFSSVAVASLWSEYP